MYRIIFSLGLNVAFMSSLPLIVNAADIREGSIDDVSQGKIVGHGTGQPSLNPVNRTDRYLRDRSLDRYPDNVARYAGQYGSYYNTPGTYGYSVNPYGSYYYGYPSRTPYGPSSYGTYDYNYSSYPSYSPYPVYPSTYRYSGYRPYNYNPGMYNPNTTFVNPPSSLNYPTGYPAYSETYNYRR